MRNQILFLLLLSIVLQTTHAQKGAKSVAAGPLISFPLGLESGISRFKVGPGVEVIGQYNVSTRSALLLKTTLTSWAYKQRWSPYDPKRLTMLTLQGGYRYHFSPAGFFIDGLVGVDFDTQDSWYGSPSFTLGAGKRFVREERFIDVGVDFVGADAEERVNIKVLISLFR